MAKKNLLAIREIIRQFLSDEFSPGTDLAWENDELDLHINDCLAEISDKCPYEVKETLTTTASSKELDISSIDDLLSIEKVEYKVGQDPPEFRNFDLWGDTLTIDIETAPAATGDDVYIYCNKLHQLTESSSTLKPQLERILILGVCGNAAIAKAKSLIEKVNIGGSRTPADMQGWGMSKLALYRADLRRLAKPKTNERYPRD